MDGCQEMSYHEITYLKGLEILQVLYLFTQPQEVTLINKHWFF